MRIFITGIGAISAIGNNAGEMYASLADNRAGIKPGVLAHSAGQLTGEIPLENAELSKAFGLSVEGSRTALLGMIAAREAFQGHVMNPHIRTGLISGTSVGGMDLSETAWKHELNGESYDRSLYRHHSSGQSTVEIARELGLKGFLNTISTACSSAANSIMMAARMMKAGQLDRVLAGGTDGLSKFTISGFKSLMIYDDQWCRPFDESRKGLNLGEGAGFLLLETEHSIAKTGSVVLAELTGYDNASDAYHQTASSPEGTGAATAMTNALKMAGLQPSDIDYINAHGTATPNNDESESNAILSVFGSQVPPFSSTKSATGHTLAASGGIEAVLAVKAIQNRVVYPNLNFREPIESTGLVPVTVFGSVAKLDHVLSNSFGFGGNNSTLIISRKS